MTKHMDNHVAAHVAKFALYGFGFGTAGLFILSMLSLMSPSVELLASPFFEPGRLASGLFAGSEGSDAEVVALTLFNGVLYALLNVVFGIFFCNLLEDKPKKH